MKVIVISGHARNGKDISAYFIQEYLKDRGEKVLITHYGDLLKYICKNFFGWNGEKDVEGRHLLQHIGTDIVRKHNQDFWVNFIVEVLTMFGNEWDYVLIPDCRFPNEVRVLKDAGFDTTHIRITRTGFESPLTKHQRAHASEVSLDGVEPDIHINNDGTLSDLSYKISVLVNNMLDDNTNTDGALGGSNE